MQQGDKPPSSAVASSPSARKRVGSLQRKSEARKQRPRRMWTQTVLLAALLGVALAKDFGNCSAQVKGSFSCHTCFDVDGGSCDWGLSCCTGSCFKLHDEDTNVVAKGCRSEKQSATSAMYDAGIEIKGNQLSGDTFYCAGDFCNAAPAAHASTLLALLAAPALALLLR